MPIETDARPAAQLVVELRRTFARYHQLRLRFVRFAAQAARITEDGSPYKDLGISVTSRPLML